MLIFTVGDRRFACALRAVREIVPERPVTRLPGAPAAVRGLMNLRGTMVTVLDLAARLGETAARQDDGMFVLVEAGPRVVGVRVDEVQDVRPVREDAFEPVADAAAHGGAVAALVRVDDGVAVLLDVDTLVAQALL